MQSHPVNLRGNDIPQLIQILISKIPKIAVTSLNVFLDPMQIQTELFKKFALWGKIKESLDAN